MKVLYTRVSTNKQSLERQLTNSKDYNLVIEDKGISGSIPFFERPNSDKILNLLKKNEIYEFHTYSIDRLGRNLRDILNTIEEFSNYKVPIHIISQGLNTFDVESGQINSITKLILQIMGSVAEMEKNLTTERIKHSLAVKKLNGELIGRKVGSIESSDKFLNKDKCRKINKLLIKGLSVREIASIVNCGTQLVLKVKKYSYM